MHDVPPAVGDLVMVPARVVAVDGSDLTVDLDHQHHHVHRDEVISAAGEWRPAGYATKLAGTSANSRECIELHKEHRASDPAEGDPR